ncbi:MAG TPA: DNRLRE domain-containing protein, partial [Anaerolineae bacterium]|nr:DNRLRE domain-containing protein [Anaerolineae bacterium]
MMLPSDSDHEKFKAHLSHSVTIGVVMLVLLLALAGIALAQAPNPPSDSLMNVSEGNGMLCCTSSIGDRVWDDADGDGVQDGGESGLNNIYIALFQDDGDAVFEPGADDNVVSYMNTAGDGDYDFTGLAAGDYWVSVYAGSVPSGYVLTTNNEPLLVNLGSGEDYNDADFGYRQLNGSTCVTIQRGTQGSVADAYIWATNPNYNGGTSNTLYTGLVGNGEKRSLLQFDLGVIPGGATIDSAAFYIYLLTSNHEIVRVHRITAAWTETGVTWNNFGDSFAPGTEGYFVSESTDFHQADVTQLVRAWVNGTYDNYGLLLEENLNDYDSYRSSEYSSVQYRPKLEVCYHEGTPTPTPTPSNPPHLETDKDAMPLPECQTAEVHLQVMGAGDPVTERRPLDVMIVLDRSGSMDDAGGTPPQPITDAKNAAKHLVDELDSSIDRVGLVSYADWATLDAGLTDDFQSVKNAIDALSTGGYTNIGDAVFKAQEELSNNGRPQAVPVIVLLSDGVANRSHAGDSCDTWPSTPTACTNDAINQAATAKSAGTVIYTIGLNLDNIGDEHGEDVENLARQVLQSMASSPANYYESPTSSELEGIFDDIANIITNVAGTDVVVTDILPPDVHYISGSAVPSPTIVSGQILTWNLGIIGITQT